MSANDGVSGIDLVSFDGGTRLPARLAMPDRYRFWDQPAPGISRGAGLSYVAASFGRAQLSIDHSAFGRILDFDSTTGVIEVEAGTRLGTIFDFARPRGFYLAVQPGHPAISVGGCIAADVHGKHQYRDGTFCDQVESLRVSHALHGTLEMSRTLEPEWFELTCGGYGLTGNILAARLRLSRLKGQMMRIVHEPVGDMAHAVEELRRNAGVDLLYTWHDFQTRGARFGRGFVVRGAFCGEHDASRSTESVMSGRPPTAAGRAALPVGLMNALSIRLLNSGYRAVARVQRERISDLRESIFPVSKRMLYFSLFGRRGFHEYQAVIPFERYPEYVEGIRQRLAREPMPVSLASAKLFGGTRRWLRFTGEGLCLALNFPRSSRSTAFAAFLDQLMLRCAGWPNIIKDSRLSAATVAASYPEYEAFRAGLKVLDPARVYRSELSERLQL